MRMKCSALFLSLFLLSVAAFAQVRLPNVLSSNMVLQRNAEISLWGWSSPGEAVKITCSWNGKTETATADGNAKWSLKTRTPEAGGPYSITFQASNTIKLENVMIGEVWLLSGQSNMEWAAVNNNKQANDEAPNANNPNIRLFHIPKTTANSPQEDCAATWKVCNPEDMKRFSTIGYFFGKQLQQELNIPIGLINASWGGTPAEAWTPEVVINNDLQLLQAAKTINPTPWWPVEPAKAYNGMIAPLNAYRIAGALWYQGESNTGQPFSYTKLFTSMIRSWREARGYDFPFYYVQIAPFAYGSPLQGAYLREAQTNSQFLPGTGMVVVSDLVDNVKDIHPQLKKEVADRLAKLALADTYKKVTGPYLYPHYESMSVEGMKARIRFTNVPNGLISKNGATTEFEIAGEDRKFYKATAVIEGNTVVVSAPEVKAPAAVRFGFGNESMPNLFSKEGLPVNLFRTDSWQ